MTHIRNFFDLGSIRDLALNCTPAGGGKIKVNSRQIELFPWEGRYVEDFPVRLEAIPAFGYKFVGWDGEESSDRSISVSLDQNAELTALFEPEDWYEPVVINEINYHSAPGFDSEDWIELYNNGSENVNLSGWMLKDSEDTHAFMILQAQQLGPGEYLLVSRDKNLFAAIHPEAAPVIGNMGFGFSGGGETVRLFNSSQVLVDSVEYDDFTPWPLEPDGKGATLALIHPDLDNTIAGSWFASLHGGTPGKENIAIGSTGIDHEQLNIPLEEPWPNPFSDRVHISYRVAEAGAVHMAVYDLQGRVVDVLVDDHRQTGEFNITWDGADCAPGVYLCVFRSYSYSYTKKLIRTPR